MEKKEKKIITKIIILSTLIFLTFVSIACTYPISKGFRRLFDKCFDIKTQGLVVHYIDVGQGDAIAIQFPNSEIVLIDSGTKDSQNKIVQYLQNKVLKSNRDKVIDYLILTHSDIDHSGGMCAVFSEFEVKTFYRPSIASVNESTEGFLTQVETVEYDEIIKSANAEKNIKIKTIEDGINFNVGSAKIEFFGPLEYYGNTNEVSPLIKISYSGVSMLFTGDVQVEAEQDLVEKYGDKLGADILKVGHHGSSDASSEELIQAVKPKFSIISVGENNTYGHPSIDVMLRIANAGAKIYRTDISGDIRLWCYKDKVEKLQDNVIITRDFIEWWIIGLTINVILVVNMAITINQLIKTRKEEDKFSSI